MQCDLKCRYLFEFLICFRYSQMISAFLFPRHYLSQWRYTSATWRTSSFLLIRSIPQHQKSNKRSCQTFCWDIVESASFQTASAMLQWNAFVDGRAKHVLYDRGGRDCLRLFEFVLKPRQRGSGRAGAESKIPARRREGRPSARGLPVGRKGARLPPALLVAVTWRS